MFSLIEQNGSLRIGDYLNILSLLDIYLPSVNFRRLNQLTPIWLKAYDGIKQVWRRFLCFRLAIGTSLGIVYIYGLISMFDSHTSKYFPPSCFHLQKWLIYALVVGYLLNPSTTDAFGLY